MGNDRNIAHGEEQPYRLAVVLAAASLLIVPWLLARLVPGLAMPLLYPGLRAWGLSLSAGVTVTLFLGSCTLLLLRRDVGALVLALLLLLGGLALNQGLWHGALSLMLGLGAPACLAVGAGMGIVRGGAAGGAASRGAVLRCPACGTVQGQAAPRRCELCDFELPVAADRPVHAAADRPAWKWGRIALVLGGIAAFLAVPGTSLMLKGSHGRGFAGLGDLLLGLLLLALAAPVWLVGLVGALVGLGRSGPGGAETAHGPGAALALHVGLLVLLPLIWVVGEHRHAAPVPTKPWVSTPPAPGGPPPWSRSTMKATSVTPPPVVPLPPEMTTEVAAAKVVRAGELLRQGRPAEAESLAYLAVTFLDRTAPGAEATWEARRVLAEALLHQRKYAFAEDVLRRGERELRSVGGPLPPAWEARRAVLLDQLAETCQATGRPDEAARLRAERGRPAWELAPPPRAEP